MADLRRHRTRMSTGVGDSSGSVQGGQPGPCRAVQRKRKAKKGKSKERTAVLGVFPRGGRMCKTARSGPERRGSLPDERVLAKGYAHEPTGIVSGGREQKPKDFICAFVCFHGNTLHFRPVGAGVGTWAPSRAWLPLDSFPSFGIASHTLCPERQERPPCVTLPRCWLAC